MNHTSGFASAAMAVSFPRLNPTVTMMLWPVSMKLWISDAYSDASAGTATLTSPAPTAVAPFCAPTNEYSLKFLSSTVPTSVTTPTFQADGSPDGEALGPVVADGAPVGVELGAPVGVELGEPVGVELGEPL